MKRAIRSILVVLASLAFAASASAQHRLVTGGAKSAFQLQDPSPRVLRSRAVSLDLPVLAKAAADPSPYLEIAPFDDAVFTVFLAGSERTHSGGLAYSGHVATEMKSVVVIVNNPDAVSVQLTVPGRRFSIQGTREAGYVARELADFDLPDHGPGYKAPPSSVEDLSKSVAQPKTVPTYSPPPIASPDTNDILDVIVVYTQAARSANGGTATMNANVDAQIALTNTIYANSVVTQRLRLVHKGEVDYTEVDMDTDLPRVASTNDGILDEVPILRDIYQADFVSLWGVYVDYCGLGYLMVTESSTFAGSAYNVTASPSCTGAGSYTFAHELGHNMGLRHDNFVDNGTNTVTAEIGGGSKTSFYSHGYYDLVNRFRTVMSYNDACVNGGFNCTRIPHFSNPNISYNNSGSYAPAVLATTGKFTGTYPGTGAAGDAYEREALNDTRDTTQNFRTPALMMPFAGPGTLTFLPTFYSVAEGAGSVTLKVGRHAGSTGAISVNYATVPSTATAGADYTTTSGTLNWANGDSADKTIVVPILQDALLEGNEFFAVGLGGATGGATISVAGAAATVRITDDEPDTFPIGSLLPGGFVSPNVPNANTPNSQWTVDLTQGNASPASLRSAQAYSPDGTFTVFGNSDLEYTGVFLAGNVTFDYKFSAYQGNYSGFEFQVDGVPVFTYNSGTAGGEINWTPVSQAITAGIHTLRWRFKNLLPFPCAGANPPPTGGANCADRAWIDNLAMPLAKAFDLSGEGRTDLVWAHTDGRAATWLMNGTAPTATAELIGAASGWSVTQVADFNGDTKSDLVWTHTDGRMAIYLMNGTVPSATQQLLNAGPWTVIHTPDLNGDGKADLVFENADGSAAVWLMNGTAMTSGASIIGPGTGWSVIRTADFDGDGKDDLLWRHTDGRHAIWLMNGIAIAATTQILNAGGWTATHTPDIDGDGRADLVWQHTDGTVALWIMNGATMTSGSGLLGAGTGWGVTRTGDFDADGKADLFFMHTDGRAAIYLMNGLVPKLTAQILNGGGGWSAKRLGDLNGDGKADIVWENVDGRANAWLMNGTVMSSSANLIGPASGWSVSGVSQ